MQDASNRAVMEVISIAQTNEQRESALRAEVHLLRRTNLRMKGEKALDHKKMSKVRGRMPLHKRGGQAP